MANDDKTHASESPSDQDGSRDDADADKTDKASGIDDGRRDPVLLERSLAQAAELAAEHLSATVLELSINP